MASPDLPGEHDAAAEAALPGVDAGLQEPPPVEAQGHGGDPGLESTEAGVAVHEPTAAAWAAAMAVRALTATFEDGTELPLSHALSVDVHGAGGRLPGAIPATAQDALSIAAYPSARRSRTVRQEGARSCSRTRSRSRSRHGEDSPPHQRRSRCTRGGSPVPTRQQAPPEPLADLEPAKASKQPGECVTCLDKAQSEVFIPCGHLCTCRDCGRGLEGCPLCRTAIERRLDLNAAAREGVAIFVG